MICLRYQTENLATLQNLGVEVYSISTATHFTHKAWHDSSETIRKFEGQPRCVRVTTGA